MASARRAARGIPEPFAAATPEASWAELPRYRYEESYAAAAASARRNGQIPSAECFFFLLLLRAPHTRAPS